MIQTILCLCFNYTRKKYSMRCVNFKLVNFQRTINIKSKYKRKCLEKHFVANLGIFLAFTMLEINFALFSYLFCCIRKRKFDVCNKIICGVISI